MSTTTTPATVADPPSVKPEARQRSIGLLVLRLHFYAGILVAPFLVVAALTRLAFVFSPQLDGLVYDRQLHVQVGAQPARPLTEQVTAAQAVHPDGDLASVIPPVEETDTTKVVFNLPELGEKQHTVYVDPYTNEVRGTLTTWFGETPLQTWLDDLHRNLHLGTVGRHYSKLAASWLWVVVLGGRFLWLRRQWTGRRKLARTGLPDLAAKIGVRRTRSWHAATGIWLAIGLLALSATGRPSRGTRAKTSTSCRTGSTRTAPPSTPPCPTPAPPAAPVTAADTTKAAPPAPVHTTCPMWTGSRYSPAKSVSTARSR